MINFIRARFRNLNQKNITDSSIAVMVPNQEQITTSSIAATNTESLSNQQETSNAGYGDEQQENSNSEIERLPTIDPKEPGAYEKLRQRNIAEREKLFRDLKISQLK